MFSFLTEGVLMHKVKFGNSYWYVLKKDSEKILLCSRSRYEEKYLKPCSYSTSKDFFREVRRYMNVDFYDSKFSESDRKHILIVKNNYPYRGFPRNRRGSHFHVRALREAKSCKTKIILC